MNLLRISSLPVPVRSVAVALAVVGAALPLVGQTQTDRESAQDTYRQDRAACMAGNTEQSRSDCLYEARSALRDRLNGDPDLADANESGGTTSSSTADTPAPMATESSDSGTDPAPQADRN